MHNELQDVMGQSFGVPDDIDEDDLMGELDALEDELAQEAENPTASGVPSYLQVVIIILLWYKCYEDTSHAVALLCCKVLSVPSFHRSAGS